MQLLQQPQCGLPLSHVFLKSDIATIIWSDLSDIFDIRLQFDSVQQLMLNWMGTGNVDSTYPFAKKVSCLVALYLIWEHRNKVLHGESSLDPSRVPAKVKNETRRIIGEVQKSNKIGKMECIRLERLGLIFVP